MNEYLYSNIVNELEEKIKNGELKDGEKLPSERVMAQQYCVSRNVVREAYKVMSEKGLVDIQIGRGAFVSIPKEEHIKSKLQETLAISNLNLSEILEVREVLEESVAIKAVERANEDNIENLEKVFKRMEELINDPVGFTEEDVNFHIELAKCTRNSMLVLLINIFNSITDKNLYKFNILYPGRVVKAQKDHRRIIDAIKEKNQDEIIIAVKSHIKGMKSEMQLIEKINETEIEMGFN